MTVQERWFLKTTSVQPSLVYLMQIIVWMEKINSLYARSMEKVNVIINFWGHPRNIDRNIESLESLSLFKEKNDFSRNHERGKRKWYLFYVQCVQTACNI